jgi:hypothetical protein
MDETWIHIYDPETKEQSKEWWYDSSPHPKKFKTQKSPSKVLASVFWGKDGILLVDYLEKGATMMHFSTNWSSNWSPNVEANFQKQSSFFKTMLLLTRWPLRSRNWQIFTLKFWNTQPTHLIWPLRTTTSFLTSRNTSREIFEHWGGHISCRHVVCSKTKTIFLGWVKELRTMKW